MNQIVERLRQQQALLAKFGSFAFRETNLPLILDEAARVCALGLRAERAKICRYRPVQNDLLVVAGFGWNKDIVGQAVSQADETSPQGRAYVTGRPVICNDLVTAHGFNLPSFYAEHHVVSTIDVIVKGLDGPPFGILEIDNTTQQDYDEHDVDFLTSLANVLAEAVATTGRIESLHHSMAQLRQLADEKDQLLADKVILAEELQHRVRNNLQLVSSMLAEKLNRTSDLFDKIGLRGIQGRVTALAKVYDHLLGVGLSRKIDFGEYIKLLCEGLPDLQLDNTNPVVLTCSVTPMLLDLDLVTALGLVVTELVANCYEHAFPDGAGRISIAGGIVRQSNWGELTISDDGIGYKKAAHESKRHGVGLVYRLMEQVSGKAQVQVDGGTTWTLAFPLSVRATELAA